VFTAFQLLEAIMCCGLSIIILITTLQVLRATIKMPKWNLLLHTEFHYKTGLFEGKYVVHVETLHSNHTDIQHVESRYTNNKVVEFLCVV
jgi:hypothetical protein